MGQGRAGREEGDGNSERVVGRVIVVGRGQQKRSGRSVREEEERSEVRWRGRWG